MMKGGPCLPWPHRPPYNVQLLVPHHLFRTLIQWSSSDCSNDHLSKVNNKMAFIYWFKHVHSESVYFSSCTDSESKRYHIVIMIRWGESGTPLIWGGEPSLPAVATTHPASHSGSHIPIKAHVTPPPPPPPPPHPKCPTGTNYPMLMRACLSARSINYSFIICIHLKGSFEVLKSFVFMLLFIQQQQHGYCENKKS